MIAADILLDGLFAAIAAIGFGAVSDPPMRAFPRIALLAAMGHALRFCLMHYFSVDIATASLFASISIGFGSLWLGRGIRCPMTALYIPALLPMVPGIYAYKTVFSLIMFLQSLNDPGEGLQYMQQFFLNATVSLSVIALLAAGATLPIFVFNHQAFSLTRRRKPRKPDCMEIFWNTIARYNAATWPWQIAIVAAAAVLTVLLYLRPTQNVKRAMKLFLAGLNAWIAVVYYLVWCGQRSHSDVLALFWGIMAVIWLYDLYADFTRFERTSRPNGFALLLYLMPLAYPLFSLARGLSFPMMTMPVMPCSVAVFTIGLMLAFTHRINIFLVLFLCHWALIGLAKVYFFGIPEDFLLAASTVPALYLFFREYIAKNRELRTKPDARMLNGLLILLCIVIGLFFTATLLHQIRLYV